MGDMGDDFREWKEHRRRQKEKYRSNEKPKDLEALHDLRSKRLLDIMGIHNNGEQYVVSVKNKVVDYYPSTGLWKVRGGRAEGHGIKNLRNYFKV